MKLETFFEKFDQFADAPGAVAKMRELVLEWAATGKLCHNDSVEWREGVLGDVIELISGQHLLAHEHNAEGRGIPYLTGPSDFGEKSPLPTRWTDQPKVTAEPGDILITVKGSGVGKTNILVEQPTAISRQLMAIRVTGADPEFVHVVLKRAAEHFQNAKTGIAIPGIGRREVLGLKVVLPHLAEQKRIVAKVDELMALCDRLEAQQQERETRHAALARASLARFADAPTPANLPFLFHPSYAIPPADLRKSILTLAVQGKLVPQDPNDEPAEELIARLKTELSKNIGGRRKVESLPEISPEEIPFDLPNGWVWERLGAIGDTNIGLTYSPQDVSEAGIPVLRSSNIQNGKLDFADLVRVKCEPKQSVMVQDGDLLICARNGSRALVGKVALIENLDEPAAFGAFMAIFRSGVNRYLYHFICSPLFRRMIDEVNTTTINQITQNNLRTTLAPIPPLAEQRRIVAKVEQLMALVDALETQLAASRATADKLLSALVAELTA